MFVSRNVGSQLSNRLSRISGIALTHDLGKYLGISVLHKRMSKNTFTDVLGKVANQVSGLKGKLISLVGRVTLAKVILAMIPTHVMSSVLLPVVVCDELD